MKPFFTVAHILLVISMCACVGALDQKEVQDLLKLEITEYGDEHNGVCKDDLLGLLDRIEEISLPAERDSLVITLSETKAFSRQASVTVLVKNGIRTTVYFQPIGDQVIVGETTEDWSDIFSDLQDATRKPDSHVEGRSTASTCTFVLVQRNASDILSVLVNDKLAEGAWSETPLARLGEFVGRVMSDSE